MGSVGGGAVVDATADDALAGDDMVALLRRLRDRDVSAAELRAAALARARATHARLNGLVSEPRAHEGPESGGPLAGIPTLIKDNEALAGWPTRFGSAAVGAQPARSDSPIVAQLLQLGLQPIGKTTLPEFGLTATTESSLHGATRNPWDTDRSTGGSSGGSAALVAAGVVPIAHANDGGGSIRIPAACCGLVGLKPSRGRLVDLPEVARLPVPIVHQGVLTRSVRDTALYYALAEQHFRNPALPPIGHVTHPPRRRLRVGVVESTFPMSADADAAVARAAALCADLGHDVAPAPRALGDREAMDFLRYWALLAFSLKRFGSRVVGGPFETRRTEPLMDGLAAYAVDIAERLPWTLARLRRWRDRPENGSDVFDVLLSPVLAREPPPIGYLSPHLDLRTHIRRLISFAPVTACQNVTGSPAISLPLGRSAAGLPMGVQFVAPVGQESLLLELALELESAAPWRATPGGTDARG